MEGEDMCLCRKEAEKLEDLCGYCEEEYHEWLMRENSLREEIEAYEAERIAEQREKGKVA
jgi:hypothetical protein